VPTAIDKSEPMTSLGWLRRRWGEWGGVGALEAERIDNDESTEAACALPMKLRYKQVDVGA